jgi:hypothetical protein
MSALVLFNSTDPAAAASADCLIGGASARLREVTFPASAGYTSRPGLRARHRAAPGGANTRKV